MVLLLLVISGVTANAQKDAAVKKANTSNDEKAEAGVLNEKVAEFLVKSADARFMDAQEGKLAVEKATLPALKKYGRWMMKDQAILLKEIKTLAAKRNITLPVAISNKKEKGREDLAEKDGSDFEKKFIKMMIIDHERDIKMFEDAIDFDDKEVSAFAKKYLPTIKAHLSKIEGIEKSIK